MEKRVRRGGGEWNSEVLWSEAEERNKGRAERVGFQPVGRPQE